MADPYSYERGKPKHPNCAAAGVAIHFNGRFLAIAGADRSFVWAAVSGRPDARGNFDYSVQRQRQGGIGPIPVGDYWINPVELWQNAFWKPAPVAAWGNFRITLHVMPDTETHGRGGFFIHGGTVAGSAGCIDLTSHMDDFVLQMRALIDRGGNCFIPVRVEY